MGVPDIGGNPPAPKPAAVLAEAHQHGYVQVFQQAKFVLLQSPTYTGPSNECHPLSSGKAR
jgi:hypothetical protein